MKRLFVVSITLLLLSCEKQGELTKDGFNVTTVSQSSILKYKATFAPTSGITASGEANLFLENGQYKLELKNFSITEGPDLKVYLSKSNTPTEFVNLGNLSSATVYSIPQSVDFFQYKYVLIHCQQYNHLFAVAQLIQI
jgi:Electron transfer DM13